MEALLGYYLCDLQNSMRSNGNAPSRRPAKPAPRRHRAPRWASAVAGGIADRVRRSPA
jgi:hypothetical protein